jgi:hypothetical protein
MEPKSYSVVLAEYAERFHEMPPSILTEEGARDLMMCALERGQWISKQDLPGPAEDHLFGPGSTRLSHGSGTPLFHRT